MVVFNMDSHEEYDWNLGFSHYIKGRGGEGLATT
jgi:hypothetical protein